MIGYHDASSALTLLILLTGASFLNLSTSSPVNTLRLTDSLHRVSSSGLAVVGNRERRAEENGSMQTGGEGVEEEEEDEDEDELFKDVDPKTLAAVLLEALNKPQMERRREGDEGEGTEEEEKEEREEATKENEKAKEVRAMDGVNRDRDRNGRQELELMMAAQGREEREREEEEERRKAQEEEEKLTERVTSRTISQTDEEEVLSPEEEEARAKAEQEEVRRQAAEAQRAKMEEEKLADIASDMLLQYMVKQNNGNRKDRDQNRKYSSLSNAAEDKRSDEEQEVMEEDDDIDPQTIDKLIEISSKLHLPADDVVDIISDVEKKKKKDVPPEMASPWQRPLMPLSSSSSSTNGPALNLNSFLGNSADYDYYSPPKRRFRNWQSYYSNYVLPSYTRTFQPLPIPKPRSYYYSPAAPIVTRDEDYYSSQSGRQADKGKDDDLEKYIQEILMKQPRMFE
uniref:VGF nerve growth factor inducible n=1 Tax=Myripristis murdjan TaxID=586833 RepID=A0A667WQN8_9TELE